MHRELDLVLHTSLTDDFNAQLLQWLQTVADVRVHGTTHQRPIERFAEEAVALVPTASQTSFLLLEQQNAQRMQGRGHVGEGCAVPECTGLALDQWQIVLPVVAREAANVTGHDDVVRDEFDPIGIHPNADHLTHQFAGDRVTAALKRDQAGARHLAEGLHVAVEGRDHRLQCAGR